MDKEPCIPEPLITAESLAMASEQTCDNEAAGNRLSVVVTSLRRVSMDTYYEQNVGDDEAKFPTAEPQEPPPSYEPLQQIPSPRRKFNIQPREDEGREELPGYSCAISLEAVFAKKLELEGAVHRAYDRNWYKVFVTLQGTALMLHKYKKGGLFEKVDGERKSTRDLPSGAKRGSLIKSYNLQHAEVGVAADYLKYIPALLHL